MKKIISGLISTALAVTFSVPVLAEDTFSDVSPEHWAYEYVEDMATKGLISGYGDGTFGLDDDVSRMDAFALFSRMLGSASTANTRVLESAKEKYKDVLAKYELSYAEGDIAFLLHRKIITEKELDTYFAGDKKTEAMPRYEAAILITKAMLAEAEATSEFLIDMEYLDVTGIPKNARQYVYYVTQKGIMNGVGGGMFAPNLPVQRSQIAVMLSKTISSANYYFEETKITDVNTDKNIMCISDYNVLIYYLDSTRIIWDGKTVTDEELKKGQSVVLTYSENDEDITVVFIDILNDEVVEKETDTTVSDGTETDTESDTDAEAGTEETKEDAEVDADAETDVETESEEDTETKEDAESEETEETEEEDIVSDEEDSEN